MKLYAVDIYELDARTVSVWFRANDRSPSVALRTRFATPEIALVIAKEIAKANNMRRDRHRGCADHPLWYTGKARAR